MANNCAFEMKITGKKENIEEIIRIFQQKDEFKHDGIGRIFSFYVDDMQLIDSQRNIFSVNTYGDCAWSVKSSMCHDAENSRSLKSEAERLHLVIEVFSSETGCQFQEHYLTVFGDVIVNDCVDYEEHWVAIYGGVDAYNKDFGTSFTEDMLNDNGDVCIGGFGDDYDSFEDHLHCFGGESE